VRVTIEDYMRIDGLGGQSSQTVGRGAVRPPAVRPRPRVSRGCPLPHPRMWRVGRAASPDGRAGRPPARRARAAAAGYAPLRLW
jgi:hypothetical protein